MRICGEVISVNTLLIRISSCWMFVAKQYWYISRLELPLTTASITGPSKNHNFYDAFLHAYYTDYKVSSANDCNRVGGPQRLDKNPAAKCLHRGWELKQNLTVILLGSRNRHLTSRFSIIGLLLSMQEHHYCVERGRSRSSKK